MDFVSIFRGRTSKGRVQIKDFQVIEVSILWGIVYICPPEIEIELKKELELERERETGQNTPTPLGRYGNIHLSESEQEELNSELPDKWMQHVERLSEYMASTRKTYQNHAAAIRRWAAEDKAKLVSKSVGQRIPDYTCGEGESL